MPPPLQASPKPPRPASPGSAAWSPAPSPLLCRMSQHLSTAGSHLAPWLFSLHFLLCVCVEEAGGPLLVYGFMHQVLDNTQTDFSGPLTPVPICLPALSMGTYDEHLALNVSKEIFFFLASFLIPLSPRTSPSPYTALLIIWLCESKTYKFFGSNSKGNLRAFHFSPPLRPGPLLSHLDNCCSHPASPLTTLRMLSSRKTQAGLPWWPSG